MLAIGISIHNYAQPLNTNTNNYTNTVQEAIKNLPVAGTAPHKVLVLGSSHFDLSSNNSDWKSKKEMDVLSPGKQQEIEQVVQLLKQFKPTRICIEWEPKLDSAFNARYQNYLAGKWTLGRGEYYQIGFRLAKEMGHTKVYCIDNKPEQPKSLIDIEDFDKYVTEQGSISEQERKAVDSLNEKYNRYIDSIKYSIPLKEYLVFLNSNEVKKENKRLFLTGLVHAGNNTTYAGADLTGHWYQRNTRIFSNVKKLCTTPEERILIIYGNMHAFVLEELFRGSQQFEVIPVSNLLK